MGEVLARKTTHEPTTIACIWTWLSQISISILGTRVSGAEIARRGDYFVLSVLFYLTSIIASWLITLPSLCIYLRGIYFSRTLFRPKSFGGMTP